MLARVLLVRHGSYELLDRGLGGRAAHSLSGQGREEATRLADGLTHYRPSVVVSSPVQRARETADLIAGRLGLSTQLDAAFTEVDFAGWTGKRFDDLHSDPAWQAWNRFRSTASVPDGETMLEVQARAVGGLMHWARSQPSGATVFVTHSDVIKAILLHFLGAPLDLMQRIDIGPCSLSELMLYPDDARIVAVNLRP